ncbi:hypothetical protein MSAR_29170 [Mycolicibacterium sarraceniae]|uniref:HTH IS21-type domain-containing protein n=1 Tax=Mycolicibacterium sarraceniae TaxID=1534348 RepID=A0A7I7STX8_9MYCO|nr:hypothetical protein MSAR_29170 [Mycolicibacterium sarraceniae]
MLTGETDVELTALRRRGWTIPAIAKHTGFDRKTVRKYLAGGGTPGVRARSGPDPFEPFLDHVTARLVEGCGAQRPQARDYGLTVRPWSHSTWVAPLVLSKSQRDSRAEPWRDIGECDVTAGFTPLTSPLCVRSRGAGSCWVSVRSQRCLCSQDVAARMRRAATTS